MGNWVENRALDALLKTLAVLVVVHLILLAVGLFFGTAVGWFGLRMFWPHWSAGWVSGLIAVVLLAVLYAVVYGVCSE